MLSTLPSLTVPVILRNLCPSDKNGSSLGSVVTTLSRPLHVDKPWNILPKNPIYIYSVHLSFRSDGTQVRETRRVDGRILRDKTTSEILPRHLKKPDALLKVTCHWRKLRERRTHPRHYGMNDFLYESNSAIILVQ